MIPARRVTTHKHDASKAGTDFPMRKARLRAENPRVGWREDQKGRWGSRLELLAGSGHNEFECVGAEEFFFYYFFSLSPRLAIRQ